VPHPHMDEVDYRRFPPPGYPRACPCGFLFRPVVLVAVAGLEGSRIALRGREDIQVEELPEKTLGGLVVYDRLRVAVAVGIVVHFLLIRLAGTLVGALPGALTGVLPADEPARGVLGLARGILDLLGGLPGRVLHALGYLAHLVRDPAERAAALLLLAIALLAAGQAPCETTCEAAGQATHGVLHLSGGLACHILGLFRHLSCLVGGLACHVLRLPGDLSGGVLRLAGHPARSSFVFLPTILLLGTSQSADGILQALYGLSCLVGGLARHVLGLLLAVLLLVLYFAHWLLLFEVVVACPYDALKRVPILIPSQPSPVRTWAVNVRHHRRGSPR
jgi:hypothetical protein